MSAVAARDATQTTIVNMPGKGAREPFPGMFSLPKGAQRHTQTTDSMNLITFSTLPSTNRYLESLDLSGVEEFTVVWAQEQTAGVGQRGNRWESQRDANLTFSVVLHPTFLPVADQYMLTKVLSLALVDWVAATLDKVTGLPSISIKWPNDIYIGLRKVCGILVSHRVRGGQLSDTICGIGININQRQFPSWLPNPTSMALALGGDLPLRPSLEGIVDCMATRYRQLHDGQRSLLDDEYEANLLRRNEWADYIVRGQRMRAKIVGVTRLGHLQLELDDGTSAEVELKELQFLF